MPHDLPSEFIILASSIHVPLPDAAAQKTWELTVPFAHAPSDTIATRGQAPTRRIERDETRQHTLTLGPELGRGGFGTVNLATQEVFGRRVAVKRLLSARDGDAGRRFYAEAVVTATLEHPNIVPIHDLVADNDQRLSLVMKCIEGVTWSALLKADAKAPASSPSPASASAPNKSASALEPISIATHGPGVHPTTSPAAGLTATPATGTAPFSPAPSAATDVTARAPAGVSDSPSATFAPATAAIANTPATALTPGQPVTAAVARPLPLADHLDILLKVCDAVAFAHERGILHRDLKPANVMVGAFGEVQVMDWGCAVAFGPMPNHPAISRVESIDQVAGTPTYMAPELAMATAAAIGPHSDVYLLGAILYEILTGTPPHLGTSVHNVLVRAGFGEIEAPEHRAPTRAIPTELSALALHALARDVGKRIGTVTAFAKGIRDYRAHAQAITLADIARAHLDAAAKNPAHADESLRKSLAAADNALDLWPGHRDTLILQATAMRAAADHAFATGAFTLAAGHATRAAAAWRALADAPATAAAMTIAAESTAAAQSADRRHLLLLRLRNALIVAVLLIVVGTMAGGLVILHKTSETVDALQKANDEKEKERSAEAAAHANEIAREKAEKQRQEEQALREKQEEKAKAEHAREWQPVVADDCSDPARSLDLWQVDLGAGKVTDGVFQTGPGGCSIWLKQPLTGDVRIEWDTRFDSDKLDSVQCFIAAAAMGQTLPAGQARNMQSGYVLAAGGYNNTVDFVTRTGRSLYRKGDTPLATGVWYHAVAQRIGSHLSLTLNDQVIFDLVDPEPLPGAGDGVGLATWGATSWKNIRISRLGTALAMDPIELADYFLWLEQATTARDIFSAVTTSTTDPDRRAAAEKGLAKAIALADHQHLVTTSIAAIRAQWPTAKVIELNASDGINTLECDFSGLKIADHIDIIAAAPIINLDITATDLTDLAPLAGMHLTSLFARYDHLTTLAPLADMKLSELVVTGNDLTDLAPLAGMPVIALLCDSNRITSLEPLATCTHLLRVDCQRNPITSLALSHPVPGQDPAIFQPARLEALDISNTGITDLAPLRGQLLSVFDCQDDHLRSLAPLAAMPMKTIDVSDNDLTDLSALAGMPLERLTCVDDHLTTLDPLDTCPHLIYLECSDNRITTLDPLGGLDSLRRLICPKNRITTIEPLRHLHLNLLACSGNPITTLDPLQGQPLQYLGADHTRITDIAAIANIPTLKDIDISGSGVTDLGPWLDHPPEHALFTCPGIPDSQLAQAAESWRTPAPRSAGEAQLQLLLRHQDIPGLRALSTPFGGHHFLLLPDNVTWTDADQQCRALHGHLATIHSDAEFDLVNSLARTFYASTNYYAKGPSWIGLHNVDGIPRWVDGTPTGDFLNQATASTSPDGTYLIPGTLPPFSRHFEKDADPADAIPCILEWDD